MRQQLFTWVVNYAHEESRKKSHTQKAQTIFMRLRARSHFIAHRARQEFWRPLNSNLIISYRIQ